MKDLVRMTTFVLVGILLHLSSFANDTSHSRDANIFPESVEMLPKSPRKLGNNVERKEISEALKKEIDASSDEREKVEKIISLIKYLQIGSRDVYNYIYQGIELAEKNNMQEETGILYYDLAWYYFSQSIKDRAVSSFKKAIEYLVDDELLVYSYCCLSNNSSWNNRHEEALAYAQKGLEIAEASKLPKLEAEALMVMGDAYRYQEDTNKARKYYLNAVDLLYFEDNNKIISPLYMLTGIYTGNTARMKPYASFFYAFQLGELFENSEYREKQMFLYNIIKATETSIFNTNILDTTIARLTISVLLILSLIIIAILLIMLSVSKSRANKKLAIANEVKAQLMLIQNHDLRKPIASLISFLDMKKHQPDIPAEDLKMMDEKILDFAMQTMSSMEDLIIWSKGQMKSFEAHMLSISVSDLFDEVKKMFAYEEEVTIVYDIPDNLSIKADDNYLKAIIRNLTQNAIAVARNAEKKEVIWQVTKVKRHVVFSIMNYGTPMNKEAQGILLSESKGDIRSNGAGLIIIRDLAKSLGYRIEVETGKETGTKISLFS
ncbi:tetratricopeptide repeat-containing sensor histidine kinase [Bacteroidales bacterium OttesenSCG-928-I14]|nr:tetratricopeptide repeat-containing sensor histidine kinase [Bacteroidales bacterium OttesenSCG-928-I14]